MAEYQWLGPKDVGPQTTCVFLRASSMRLSSFRPQTPRSEYSLGYHGVCGLTARQMSFAYNPAGFTPQV